MAIGVMHPGEMGAAIGAAVRAAGKTVMWASDGRSAVTVERANRAGLVDAGDVQELCRRCDVLISVCPPHAALEVARRAARFSGVYLDANAVSPQTARTIGDPMLRFVDGGIVGPPPREPGTTRLYLSGADAGRVAALFTGTTVDARVISALPGAASALKASYAAWTKGSAALLLSARALAQAEGVEDMLLEEWQMSQPGLEARSVAAAGSAASKGWRWVGEMNEIAASFASTGLPSGFHRAAAEIYRRASERSAAGQDALNEILRAIRDAAPRT
jgi:3-hydroxyisobutyrate dehydrogenase-like beta-hydroxyacid dehydrogenase